MSETTSFTLETAVDLAHALVSSAASRVGVHCLFIKGPSLELLGLRAPRISSDVDVLVQSSQRAALIEELIGCGWRVREKQDGGHLLPDHAVHLINPTWPCDIDVHDSYPGLYASSDTVFSTFWQNRVVLEIAARPVNTPDRVASSIILAAHSLRDPSRHRSSTEMDHLVEVISESFSAEERARLHAIAGDVRALETLAPFLRRIGINVTTRDLNSRERREWALRISDASRSLGWASSFIRATWRQKPRMALRALIPPEQTFRAEHPETAPGRIGLWSGRFRRIVRGVPLFVSALRTYSVNRREMRIER